MSECYRCDPPNALQYVLEGDPKSDPDGTKYLTYIPVCDHCIEEAKLEFEQPPRVLSTEEWDTYE